METEVNVRIATKEDMSAIVAIGQEWIPFNSEALEKRYATLDKVFDQDGRMFFVAENGERIVGWMEVFTYQSWFMLRKVVHVKHAVVTAKYRGMGIGTKILNHIFDYFKDKEEDMYVILFVTESSWNGFFEKHNKMINSGQNLFIKLIEKKKRT